MPQEVTNHVSPGPAAKTNWTVVGLLVAILLTQVAILFRLPAPAPTIAAVRSAKTNDARMELLQSIPLVRVQGGTIDADITGTVDVEVQNTPLEVQVYR